MSCPINPLGDRIVAIAEEAKSITKSGIYLPDNAKEKSKISVVKEVGPAVSQIKKGDRIVYREYSTTDLKIDGTDYIVVKEEDVLATVK